LPGSQGHKAHVCFIAPGVKPRLSSQFASSIKGEYGVSATQ
jgi:hypothetical protein